MRKIEASPQALPKVRKEYDIEGIDAKLNESPQYVQICCNQRLSMTRGENFMPKSHFMPKMRLIIAAFAVLSSAMLVASGLPAQAATPAVTQSNCGENVQHLVQQCTSLKSSGTHIDSLSGWSTHLPFDLLSYPDVHIELYGPAGTIKNCGQITNWEPGDTTPTCTWSPNDTRAKGNYCSRTWSHDGTSWLDLANECDPLPAPMPNPSP